MEDQTRSQLIVATNPPRIEASRDATGDPFAALRVVLSPVAGETAPLTHDNYIISRRRRVQKRGHKMMYKLRNSTLRLSGLDVRMGYRYIYRVT